MGNGNRDGVRGRGSPPKDPQDLTARLGQANSSPSRGALLSDQTEATSSAQLPSRRHSRARRCASVSTKLRTGTSANSARTASAQARISSAGFSSPNSSTSEGISFCRRSRCAVSSVRTSSTRVGVQLHLKVELLRAAMADVDPDLAHRLDNVARSRQRVPRQRTRHECRRVRSARRRPARSASGQRCACRRRGRTSSQPPKRRHLPDRARRRDDSRAAKCHRGSCAHARAARSSGRAAAS
jgi:hypothetical protein